MKKTYMKPVSKVVRIKMTSLIAASPLGIHDDVTVTDKSDLLGRDFDFDDDEE